MNGIALIHIAGGMLALLCGTVALFIATGSFFLGPQDDLPQFLRESSILFLLAFAPFALMTFWLARIRYFRNSQLT